jgi:ABC-type transporter Mla maintaining outer membrane lipid asymmetry ATPase subunit MlaF
MGVIGCTLEFALDRRKTGYTPRTKTHQLAAFRISDYIVMLDKGGVLLSGAPKVFHDSDIELVKKFVSKGFRTQTT